MAAKILILLQGTKAYRRRGRTGEGEGAGSTKIKVTR